LQQKAPQLTHADGAALEEQVEGQLRTDLRDLAILSADLHVCSGRNAGVNQARKQAREQLDETEAFLGSDPVLRLERNLREQATANGAGQAEASTAPESLPRTAPQYYALGRFFMRSAETRRAAAALEQAIRIQPNSFWSQFYFGVCSSRLGRDADGVTAFSACIALEPARAPAYYNRALAYEKLGLLARATDDYGSAVRCDPGLAGGLLEPVG
jgi:tetratricopeptide (TPR) repeat protein